MSSGIVYQPRCPGCLREHYALNAPAISTGVACPHCGHAKVYTRVSDYRADLAVARATRGKEALR